MKGRREVLHVGVVVLLNLTRKTSQPLGMREKKKKYEEKKNKKNIEK